MSAGVDFRGAVAADEAGVRELVASAGLPSSDISLAKQEFVVALAEGRLVGCVGLEPFGESGLLRSFAVVPERRGGGLGTALFRRVLARAALRGVRVGYVLTTTAERFCLREGFERIERSAVPADVAGSAEFRSLCPATAVCLRRNIAPGRGWSGDPEGAVQSPSG